MSDKKHRTHVRATPCVVVPGKSDPLHIPHRSRHVPPDAWCDYPRPVPSVWAETAARRGFRIDRRVRDRYHLALECLSCGAQTAVKVAALRDAAVRCGGCAADARAKAAHDADLTFLRRDPASRHYGYFRAPCGHTVRRQFELIRRVRDGENGLRCSVCLVTREQDEARAHGWDRVGPDPSGNANYRLYRHPCGCHIPAGSMAVS